jgi:hypothetical protein
MSAITVFLTPNEASAASATLVGAQIGNDTVTDGALGISYSAWIAASGTPPISWELEQGSLPNGLKWTYGISNGGRVNITGTPDMPGTFTFRFHASNQVSRTYGEATTSRKDFTINIKGPSRITTTSLPDGAIGAPYNQALSARGPVLNWAIDSGALPAGLDLGGNGVIFGTPTTQGSFSFMIKTTNAWASDYKPLTIMIGSTLPQPIKPTITTLSLQGGSEGTAYNETLNATGTTQITWSIDNGSLPNGLNINGTTGIISGTPTTAGMFSFTIKATNTTGIDTKTFSITVDTAGGVEESGEGEPSGDEPGGGGGGGCYVGFGVLPMWMLVFTAIMLVWRKE